MARRVEVIDAKTDAKATALLDQLSVVLGNTVILLGVLDGSGGMYFIPHPGVTPQIFDYLGGVNWGVARLMAAEFSD